MSRSIEKRVGAGLLFLCTVVLCLLPVLFYVVRNEGGFTYVLTSIVFSLPLVFLLLAVRSKWVKIVLFSLLLIFTLVDTFMVVGYGDFSVSGTVLSIVNTNWVEGWSLLSNSLGVMLWCIPGVLLYVLVVCMIIRGDNEFRKVNILLFVVSVVIGLLFVVVKVKGSYKGTITYTYYVKNRILNRPPYNIPFQIGNAIHVKRLERYVNDARDFAFNSRRSADVSNREVYVLCIGESMNYEHLSLNGVYHRSTTPCLERETNAVLYDNYYSGGCLTLLSVPQILTRATATDYELCYREKGCFMPYKECGFHTAVIVCDNLLAESRWRWLTDGVDDFIVVENDSDMSVRIDSLMAGHEKLMVVAQLLGNHFGYYNYTPDFDRYRPNVNTDKGVVSSDNMYINAYDNTILYTDYVLSRVIDVMGRDSIVSAMIYTSDHGEDMCTRGHGGNCRPSKEEYHVPLIWWNSDEYAIVFPEKVRNARKNKERKVSSDNIFYTVCDMGGIILDSMYSSPQWSVCSDSLEEHERCILLPDYVSVMRVD